MAASFVKHPSAGNLGRDQGASMHAPETCISTNVLPLQKMKPLVVGVDTPPEWEKSGGGEKASK